jgi:outer membrane biosynthesis protein TonB
MGPSLASSRGHYWRGGARRLAALILSMTLGALSALSTGSAQTIKTSGERKVISRVAVTYPKLAQQMRLRGTVKVSATVAPTGKVVKTELIGGSPVFVPYALNAVSLLKWEPGPKETTEIVEIDFVPTVRQ